MKSLKISEELHRKVKAAAAEEGRTLQDYLMEIVEARLSVDPDVSALVRKALALNAVRRSKSESE